MSDVSEEVKRLSLSIAMWHGQKMVCVNRDGTQTVASLAGYGNWGYSPTKFADNRWEQYTGVANFVLDLLSKQIVPRGGEELSSCDFMMATG